LTTLVHPVDLEPSLVGRNTYATRRRRVRIDVAVMLSIMICLLYLMPEGLILPSLPLIGRPALVIALALCCWWLLARLNPWLVVVGPQPLRWAVLVYLLALLMSYLAGLLRGLTALEANGQDTAVLAAMQFLGIMLVAADGIPNWARLHGVLRVLLWGAGFMALTGLMQASLHLDITMYFQLPGLQLKGVLAGLEGRGFGGQFRVAGTALHFIEFSALMAMVLPYAIHYARFAPLKRHRRMAAVVAVLTAAANPLSVSRTGIVALAAVLLVMMPIWNWRLRYHMLVIGVMVTGALMVVRPGLIGTVRSLFAGASNDPSIKGRTQDYESVGHWFAQRPWLGRGPFTLIPDLYGGIVLDNQWLYALVTTGLIGVAALATMHITGIVLATIAMRRSTEPAIRHLCAALISTQVIAILVEGTVDAFYYTTYTSTLALLLGVSGAVWRFTHPARTIRTSTVRWDDSLIPQVRTLPPPPVRGIGHPDARA
jgi:polysaccharide biosynthesis protein PslJ